MLFQVSNFGGCQKAEVPVSRIALLIGDGGASKTSILTAIAAAATGQTVPVASIKKSEATRLLRAGAEKGEARWFGEDDNGESYEAVVRYPKAAYESQGAPPPVSEFAAGLKHILDIDAKKRSAILSPLLKSVPTRDDLLAALREVAIHQPDNEPLADGKAMEDMKSLGLDPRQPLDMGLYRLLMRLWEKIDLDSWDKAHSDAKEKGAKIKGQWEQVTGASYGSKLAENWLPATGWSEGLEDSSLEKLEAEIVKKRNEHEAVVAGIAVDSSKVEELRGIAGSLNARKNAAEKAAKDLSAKEKELADAVAARDKLPSGDEDNASKCPKCQARLLVKGAILVEAPPIESVSEEELKKRRLAIASADGTVSRLTGEVNRARTAKKDADKEVSDAEDACKQLAGMSEISEDERARQQVALEGAREAVRVVEERRDAFKAWSDARRLHRAVGNNQVIIDLLAENGVRRRKLIKVLDAFNASYLAPLCDAAGWKPVTLNEEFEAEYGGRATMLCKSEQHRVRFVLQIAMAQLDGSALVLIDDADALPNSARGGLLAMLASTNLNAVVTMMVDHPSKAPDLAAGSNPIGATLWVQGGVTMPHAEALQKLGQTSKKAA